MPNPVYHMILTPSVQQLKQAIQISEQIAELEAELASLLNSSSSAEPSDSFAGDGASKPRRKRRKMSAEAREKIAAGQRARWAKRKGRSAKVSKEESKAPKRKKRRSGITPAGRAKLAAMMKARWAARKKGAAAPNAKK